MKFFATVFVTMVALATVAAEDACNINNRDIPGGDIKWTKESSFWNCKERCRGTSQCIAVTYHRWGIKKGRCYLKKGGYGNRKLCITCTTATDPCLHQEGGSCDCTKVNSDTFTATEVVYGSNAEITALKPAAVGTKTITNGGSETQSVMLSVAEEVSDTVSFTHTAGASVTVGASFSAGIPGVVDGEVSTEATASYEFSYGTEKSITNTITAEFTCQGPAGKRTVCKAMLFKDQISIPYTMTWQKKINPNCVCKEQGLFKEVASTKLEMEVSETPLEEEVLLSKRSKQVKNIIGGFRNYRKQGQE